MGDYDRSESCNGVNWSGDENEEKKKKCGGGNRGMWWQ